jgi:hypothetical protein
MIGIGCVIDQVGYHSRGRYMVALQDSFSICVERATKYARLQGRRVKVNVKRADPKAGVCRSLQKFAEVCKAMNIDLILCQDPYPVIRLPSHINESLVFET